MKVLKLIAVGVILLVSSSIHAQISVNVNIGTPPAWGPVGYANVEYYYLPDVEAYYDIRATQFIYFGGGKWTRSRYLPGHYRNYDLYNGYKVVLNDYHGSRPYTHYHDHKRKYYKGYKGKPQKNYRDDRHDYDDHDHDNHKSKGNNGKGNGNGHGKH